MIWFFLWLGLVAFLLRRNYVIGRKNKELDAMVGQSCGKETGKVKHKMINVDTLQREENRLSTRIYEINKKIHILKRDERKAELQCNVGKCFVEHIAKNLGRHYYVIGVDKEAEQNEVLSIIISGKWMEFERMEISLDIAKFRQIPRKEFIQQVQRIKPFFERALKCPLSGS